MENERIVSNAKFSAKRSIITGIIGIVLVLGICIGLNFKEMHKLHKLNLDNAELTEEIYKKNEGINNYYEDYKSDYGLFNYKWWTATKYANEYIYGVGSYHVYEEEEWKSTYLFGVEVSKKHITRDKKGQEKRNWTKEISKVKVTLLWLALIVPISLMFLLAVLPLIISKLCSLTLTDRQVYGKLKTLIGKKKLQIPIDHLDSVMTSRGIIDVLCGGETLIIQSNAGRIKFHYVSNAEEFASAAMACINEYKRTAPVQPAPQQVVYQQPAAPAPAPAPAPVQNISGGDAMEKLNSLKQMLDSGLISQEDFDRKKEDILSKM